jgi:SAM-dependent methyltransferase
MAENLEQTRKSYDLVAEEYVRRLYHELESMPLDCEVLERFAAAVRDQGLVCEIGCGPGQVARYLHERGVAVQGLDLSPRMVELARQLNPGIEFQEGDMAKLEAQDASWAGIVAFYSIIHIPRSEVVAVLSEWRRVLRPGGLVLLSFHRGQQEQHVDTLWDKQISLDFTFFALLDRGRKSEKCVPTKTEWIGQQERHTARLAPLATHQATIGDDFVCERPEMFAGLQLRRVGRQKEEMDALRHEDFPTLMPPGPIQHQHNMPIRTSLNSLRKVR